MADLNDAVFAGWISRGLGGLATILERFAESELKANSTHLGEMGSAVQRMVDAYHSLRVSSGIEGPDLPPPVGNSGSTAAQQVQAEQWGDQPKAEASVADGSATETTGGSVVDS